MGVLCSSHISDCFLPNTSVLLSKNGFQSGRMRAAQDGRSQRRSLSTTLGHRGSQKGQGMGSCLLVSCSVLACPTCGVTLLRGSGWHSQSVCLSWAGLVLCHCKLSGFAFCFLEMKVVTIHRDNWYPEWQGWIKVRAAWSFLWRVAYCRAQLTLLTKACFPL